MKVDYRVKVGDIVKAKLFNRQTRVQNEIDNPDNRRGMNMNMTYPCSSPYSDPVAQQIETDKCTIREYENRR